MTRRPRGGGHEAGQREQRTTVDLTWEAAEATIRAAAEALKTGLEFAPKPEGASPDLPEDPTELDDSALMTLFTKFMAWVDYSATHLGLAEVDESMWKNLLDEKRDIILLRTMPTSEALRKREDTMTRVKAEVDTHHEVIALGQEHATAYARRKLLATMNARYDNDAFVLSREITRRSGGQEPKQRRVSRWTP